MPAQLNFQLKAWATPMIHPVLGAQNLDTGLCLSTGSQSGLVRTIQRIFFIALQCNV